MRLLLLLLVVSIPGFAQLFGSGIPLVASDPDGLPCAPKQVWNYQGTLYTCVAGAFQAVVPPGGGEANTLSTQGTGVSIVGAKSGTALGTKSLQSTTNRLTIEANADNNHVDFTLEEANLSLNKSQVGLGNVDNTSDATKNSATATLTNKTLTLPIIGQYTVATLPAAGTAYRVAIVTDSSSIGDCTVGGGSAKTLCYDTGAAWASLGDGGGAASTLDALTDVVVSSPTDGQCVRYVAAQSRWENLACPGGIATVTGPGFVTEGSSVTWEPPAILAQLAGNNTWTGNNDFSGASQLVIPTGTTPPATCTAGELFYDSDDDLLKKCGPAADTWGNVGNGAAAPSIVKCSSSSTTTTATTVQTFDTVNLTVLDGDMLKIESLWSKTGTAGIARYSVQLGGQYLTDVAAAGNNSIAWPSTSVTSMEWITTVYISTSNFSSMHKAWNSSGVSVTTQAPTTKTATVGSEITLNLGGYMGSASDTLRLIGWCVTRYRD